MGGYTLMAVESPCVRQCRIKEGVCMGCNRTLDEVAYWPRMNDEEKKKVIDRLKELN